MKFWYLIDTPRNKPCWEVNPQLWEYFTLESCRLFNTLPKKDPLYTEQYVVQLLDTTTQPAVDLNTEETL